MPAPRFVWVTDVPTPYRVHQLGALSRELAVRGAELEVLFMARTVPWRFWRLDESSFGFSHRIVAGVHPRIDELAFHLNPGIPFSVLRRPPTWLMVGGAWWMPSALLAVCAADLRSGRCKLIIGAEANPAARTFHRGPVAEFRRVVMRRADAFLVPGRIARDAVAEACGTERPFLPLPNLVDEATFGQRVEAMRSRRGELRTTWGVEDAGRVLVWPARLSERHKGILRFLETVGPLLRDDVKILIPGEGPDRRRMEEWLRDARLPGVRLLGQVGEEQMVELLALADGFLLPSLADPNPLSVVEALWAGLPILMSNRCGNWPEAVEAGRNGWVVDPEAPDEVRSAFEDLLGRETDLARMGRASAAIATERFSTPRSVATFVDGLEGLVQGRAA